MYLRLYYMYRPMCIFLSEKVGWGGVAGFRASFLHLSGLQRFLELVARVLVRIFWSSLPIQCTTTTNTSYLSPSISRYFPGIKCLAKYMTSYINFFCQIIIKTYLYPQHLPNMFTSNVKITLTLVTDCLSWRHEGRMNATFWGWLQNVISQALAPKDITIDLHQKVQFKV